MAAYYNEIDPYCAQWLRNLIAAGHIADGDVDERSIVDVRPDDLRGYAQCHFFAGIGGWSLALRIAGWPDDRPVWTGSCPCFPAGTLILTPGGYVPIELIKPGDEVLTHKARWRRVSSVGSETSELVRVRGQGHWGMVVTPGHPFLTGENEWTNASNLCGKRWRTVASVPEQPVPPIENRRGVIFDRGRWRATGWKNGGTVYIGRCITEADAHTLRRNALANGTIDVRGADAADPTTIGFARFLGYWLGDGWTSGKSVFLCGAKEHGALLAEILSGANLACSLSIERTSARARCGSMALVAWLNENFGSGASEKRIPAWLHGMSEDYRRAFLSGYAEADGHREGNRRVWTTTSRALAIGVRVLLNQSGVSASITKSCTKRVLEIEGRLVSERPFYKVKAYDSARSFRFSGDHGLGLVRAVEPAGSGKVYNLAVDEDESYTADGIAVHNCQPFSNAGQRNGIKDERHLWPVWFRLIQMCRPEEIYGEQVASSEVVGSELEASFVVAVQGGDYARANKLAKQLVKRKNFHFHKRWLDAVHADMESEDYTFRFKVLGAHSVGAPHIRQRLYFAAHRLADAGRGGNEHQGYGMGSQTQEVRGEARKQRLRSNGWNGGATGGLADADSGRPQARCEAAEATRQGYSALADGGDCRSGPLDGFWRDADWLYCRDGKWRPVQPEIFPLASGISARVGQLRAAGNAISPQQAAAFIMATSELP